ncbi:hypothetical protein HF283_18830, partial [Acidithiobacillus ferrooxidans]|nr:hypothetical protein [Acidithiobacillus ferrooxidans]
VITDRDELIDSSIRYKRYNFDIVGGSINTLVKLIHDDCTIRRGVYAHMVGHSKVLFEVNNEASDLRTLAVSLWDNGTNVCPSHLNTYRGTIDGILANIKNIHDDLEKCINIDGERLYVTANLVWAMTQYITHKKGRWIGGVGKWQFRHLREANTDIDDFVQACYAYLLSNDPSLLIDITAKYI